MNQKNLMLLGWFLVAAALPGCASMNSEFNCPAGKGVGCKNIHDVNQMVNDGELGSNEKLDKFQVKPATAIAANITMESSASLKRTQEKSLSIWIASYEDKNGNYHEATTIHTVVQSGEWDRGVFLKNHSTIAP